jgi:protein-S-isoprenylcysteine O-methyltransferase Ste14
VWARWIAAAIGVCLNPMAIWVFRSLGSNVSETVLTRDAQRLVTVGPYRWIRHPLYATGGLLFVVTGLLAANAMILALAIVALALIVAVVIPREEAALVGRFGDDYRTYMRHTGRLLPRWPRD